MMGVRILPMDTHEPEDTGEYLAVRTCNDPADNTVTLATICRVVERTVMKKPTDSPWHIKTLVVDHPMTIDAAMGFATCYAERKNIPVIFTEEE